ncbi:hypothetical protein FUAX_32560 [Fulvitalea axinellae]|uniref:DUF2752 domain-containing protein n=1 Tax=Fulvitalea axinellae TaxID=1182444 RepID=A0AAU9CWG2_9BACT|nr:hypothetical protein FUAX_32560 [Fulvitalea axinellae]
MEIAFFPNKLLRGFIKDVGVRYDFNVLASNILLLVIFLVLKDSFLELIGLVPHFCLIDRLFGVECPVCGTTRAFCEMSKGNFAGAWSLNPTSLAVATFFLIQIPLRTMALVKKDYSIKITLFSKYFSQLILAIIIINWLINF